MNASSTGSVAWFSGTATSVRSCRRNKKEINDQYPEIEDAFQKMKGSFIIDGEIVAFEGNVTSFSRLQKRMHSKEPNMDVAVLLLCFRHHLFLTVTI